MKKIEVSDATIINDMEGIPGIGPGRRAALVSAGITTRAQLAALSIDRLVTITGIQRSYAARAIDAALASGQPTESAEIPVTRVPDAGDETVSETEADDDLSTASLLENSLIETWAALAQVAGKFAENATVIRRLAQISEILDITPDKLQAFSAKRQQKFIAKLQVMTSHFLKALAKTDFKAKQIKKFCDQLKDDRDEIDSVLPAKSSRKSKR